jgi:hypothetical protein
VRGPEGGPEGGPDGGPDGVPDGGPDGGPDEGVQLLYPPTLSSIFDSDWNKTITKKLRPKLCSAKGMASLYFCSDNCVI